MKYQMQAISVEHVMKRYRKGQTGYRTLREDIYNLTGKLFGFARDKGEPGDDKHLWALQDISFSLGQGETLGVIGSNGAGKTTLLRLLAGVAKPTEGKIAINGRKGALIDLMAGFHPDLTGRENVYLNGAILGMRRKEIDRKFDSILEFAELEGFMDTPVKRYSSGMMVRLGFSVAAHVDPEVLLVDEVLSVGDVAFQAKCFKRMASLLETGCALLLVSHAMPVVQRMCERVIWLDKGRIKQDGPASDVCSSYSNYMISSSSNSARTSGISVEYADPDICLKSVEVRGKNSVEPNRVCLGDDCTITIRFETRRRLIKPAFLIGIKNATNLEVAVLQSKSQGDSTDFEGCGVATCTVQNLSVFPGAYQVRVSILSGTHPGALLTAHNAAAFQVTSDSPGWSLMRGIILPPHRWDYNDG